MSEHMCLVVGFRERKSRGYETNRRDSVETAKELDGRFRLDCHLLFMLLTVDNNRLNPVVFSMGEDREHDIPKLFISAWNGKRVSN